MNAEINKEFIFRYLSGKSSALQKQMVDEWVKVPAQEELFYQWLVEYEYQNPQYIAKLSEAIGQFNHYADQIAENGIPEEEPTQREAPVRQKQWGWLLAASVVFALLAGSVVFRDDLRYKTYASGYGETKTIVLSDSSRVALNANSRLRVPRFGFGSATREVHLTGEASFSVTHQPNHQKFIVRTSKGLDVVVLGTEFTVYSRQKKAKVVLSTGKVRLQYLEGKTRKALYMKPGDLVTMDEDNHLNQEITTQPEKYTAWREHRFVFDDTTLREFAQLMQDNYGMKVIIEDSTLANRTLVGSFQADNPEELLYIVSRIFDIRVVENNDTIYLTP